ncbi:hypothetical protein OG21DRAFT_1606431 [Imleria badia]|nr:hypothetical protein OG21DRAFT_1606431 [Imleria badia]
MATRPNVQLPLRERLALRKAEELAKLTSDETQSLDTGPEEDILSAFLESLYGFTPITFSTAGSVFTGTYPTKPGRIPLPEQEIATRDTDPSNWPLHASSILYHLEELQIDAMTGTGTLAVVHVLELGAGAGLPSILLARMYQHASGGRLGSISCGAWGTDVEPLVHPRGGAQTI